MKKVFIFIMFCCYGSILPALTIQNTEQSPLYYSLVDGRFLLEDGKLSDQKIRSYLIDNMESFDVLYSTSFWEIEDVESDNTFFVGIYENNGINTYLPVVLIPLNRKKDFQSGNNSLTTAPAANTLNISRNNILLDIQGNPFVLSALSLEPPHRIITLDNNFFDWNNVPSRITFSRTFIPPVVTREEEGGITSIPLSDSEFWPSMGTSIRSIKSVFSGESLFMLISTNGEMDSEISYMLYLYDERDIPNKWSIEISPERKTGPVVLWQKDHSDPLLVGFFNRGYSFIEIDIRFEKLPEELKGIVLNDLSMDLTSFLSTSTGYEEYFYTTLYGLDIMVEE